MERAQVSLLAQARYEKGWSQEKLAEQMRVDTGTVARWERGLQTPHPRHLVQLCKILGKTPTKLGYDGFVMAQNTTKAQTSEEAVVAPVPQKDSAPAQQTMLLDDETEEDAYVVWRSHNFSVRLLSIVWNWPGDARYHKLQAMITLELAKDNSKMTPDELTRRDALQLLASFAIETCGLSAQHPVLKKPIEEILKACAAGITASWHLRRGREASFENTSFANYTVSTYIPTLEEITKTASEEAQRKAAAGLVAQCYLLKSKLAMHLTNNSDSIRYGKLAEIYGEKSGNLILQIVALRRLEAEYYYACLYEQALQVVEKAKYLLENAKIPIPHKLHSYIYAGLAGDQAFFGQRQDALKSLGKAHTTFFTDDDEPVPIWIDYDEPTLVINDGLTHMYLGMFEKAADSFKQVEVAATSSGSKRIQALINQVMVEVSRDDQPRDMDKCIVLWTKAMEKTKALQSEQWFGESRQAYIALRAAWPGEDRIKKLRDHINHW